MKPSQWKSLAGFYNTTADGLNGFNALGNIVVQYMGRQKRLLDKLEQAKRYLKIGFPQHCSEHSSCPSHCITFALSDQNDPNLCKDRHFAIEGHSSNCNDCSNLCATIDEIIDTLVESEFKNKDDILYDANAAKENIMRWTQHIIRHVQQNKAKIDAIELLSDTTGLWIRDYCQKVLPLPFRESQSSYFGKKGMTVHVDVFLTKSANGIKKKTYFSTAYRSDQDVKDSLSLADHVIKQFTLDFPDIQELFAKCDNAGCQWLSWLS